MSSREIPNISIGRYKVKDYCSICPYKENKCVNFSFIDIMYSKIPSILNLAQLSLGRFKSLNLSDEEYSRLVNYNIQYISFLEEFQSRYRKALVVMKLSNFNFSTWAYAVIDEIYHIVLKWFEKLVFWNRANSIKASPCTYYKELLSNNLDFLISLIKDTLATHNHGLLNIVDFDALKESFKKDIKLEEKEVSIEEFNKLFA